MWKTEWEIPIHTSNKPGGEEAAEETVKGIGLGVTLLVFVMVVLGALTHVGQVLDDSEYSAHYQVDGDVPLQRAVVQVFGTWGKRDTVVMLYTNG